MSATSKKLSKRKAAPAKKTLAIDFDGVIWDPRLGHMCDDSLYALDMLTKRFRVIIYSARAVTPAGQQMIRDILQHHAIPVADVTSIKPMADLYIDDKAIHHTDWDNTLQQISQRLSLPINVI